MRSTRRTWTLRSPPVTEAELTALPAASASNVVVMAGQAAAYVDRILRGANPA
jgi:hypothetical protein